MILHIPTRAVEILSLLDVLSLIIFVKPCASLNNFGFTQSEHSLLSVNGEKNNREGNNKEDVSGLYSS